MGLLACFGLLVAACGSAGDACVLSNPTLEPLAAAVDPNPQANAKLRAFFASARAIRDAAAQAEETTRLACVAIGADLGLSDQALHLASGDSTAVCGSAASRIRDVLKSAPQGFGFGWNEPRCEPSAERLGRCEALCATSVGRGVDEYCRNTCAMQAATYATCDAAEVRAPVWRGEAVTRDIMVLSATMRRNLPWLVHAQRSLVGRLAGDVENLVKIGRELPRLVPDAGPQGMACLAGAMQVLDEARGEFSRVAQSSASILDGLPKVPPSSPAIGDFESTQGS